MLKVLRQGRANFIDLFEAIRHWSLCVRLAICLFVKLFPLSQLLCPFVWWAGGEKQKYLFDNFFAQSLIFFAHPISFCSPNSFCSTISFCSPDKCRWRVWFSAHWSPSPWSWTGAAQLPATQHWWGECSQSRQWKLRECLLAALLPMCGVCVYFW